MTAMEKLDRAAQRAITRDWAAAFPELASWKPMWLGRLVGPVLQGIVLDRDSSGRFYFPKWFLFHMSDWEERRVITLGVAPYGPDAPSVAVRSHADRCSVVASRIRAQLGRLLDARPAAQLVVDFLDAFPFQNPYDFESRRIAVLVLAGCGRKEEARARLAIMRSQAAAASNPELYEDMMDRMLELVSSAGRLDVVATEALSALGRIPRTEFADCL